MANPSSDPQGYDQPLYADLGARIRDLEEKQRLLKDRLLIVGEGLIGEKEKSLMEIQEMKKTITVLKQENDRMKQILQNITEQLSNTARKTDLEILQRQFDLFRKA
jgi:hypothetical protein